MGPSSFSSVSQNPTYPSATTAMSGTYTVTVTSAAGCSSTGTTTVTVNALPVVTASSGTFCEGSTINLSSTGGSMYSWTGPNSFSSTSQNPALANATPAMAGTYTVTATNSGTSCSNTATTTVALNLRPVISLTAPNNFCSNTIITLSAAGSTAGSGSISGYQWQLNGSNISGAIASTYTTSSPGIYEVVITNSNGCSSAASKAITVLPAPDINAGVVTITPSDCGGSNGAITGITSSNPGTLTYVWTNSVPATVGTSTTTADLLNQPAGTYNLTVNSSNGCSATSGPYSITNPTAPPAPTATATVPSVCAGGTITLSAGNITNAIFNWSGPNSFNSTAQNPAPITNVTAANAGVYSVTATVAGCTGPAASVTVVVNANPTAAITGTTAFCAGSSSVLSAASSTTGSGSISSYQWQMNGSNISGAISSTYTATAAGNYQVVVTNSNNCVNTSSTTTIVVNANPIAQVSGNTSFCAGTNTVLSAALSAAGSGTINSYQWQFNGSNISGATAQTYTATVAGNYQVVIANTNNCDNTSVAYVVSINANPVANIAGNSSFCAGTNVLLDATASSAGSGTINGYQWQLNGSNISGATASSYTATSPGNYAVVVSNSNNCTNTSAVFVLTVNANPTASVTGSNNICVGAATTLSASNSTAGSGIINDFQWQLNGNNIPGANSSTYIANTAGNYQVVVTNSNNCTTTSSTFAIAVHANPVANATGTPQICAGQHSVLYANTSVAGSGIITSYQWQLNGTNISGANANTYTAISPGVYNVIVTNSNNCKDSADYTLIVNANPSALLTANPAIICSNTTTTLDGANSNAGSGSINSYQWQLNGVNIPGATSVTHIASVAGNYSLIVGNTNNCFDTTSASINLIVNQAPTAIANGSATFCSGLSTTLNASASISGSSAINAYQWLYNGVAVNGATNVTYVASNAGTYQVIVTNGDNCKDTSLTLNIIENALPVINGPATMQQSACNGSTGALSNLTVSGVAPFTYIWTNNSNVIVSTSTISSDLTNQPAGIYLLTVTDANGCINTYGKDTIENIGAPPQPGYSQPQPYCQGQTIAPLIAISNNSGTLSWYSDQALTTQIGSGTPFDPAISTTTTGTFTYYVTETISGCEGLASAITITVNPTPGVPNVTQPNAICNGQAAPTLNATGSGGTLTWYSDAALTAPLGTGISYTPAVTTTTTFWVAEYLGACRGPSVPVTITFKPLPPAPSATSPSYYCSGQSIAPLVANGTSGVLNWYADAALNPVLETGNSFNTGTTVTDTFYVAETLNGCEGPATMVYITVNPVPVFSATGLVADELCGQANGGVSGIIISGGTPAYTYNWTNTSGTLLSNTADLTNVPMGIYQLTVTDANNCTTASTSYTVAGSGHVTAAFTTDVNAGLAPLTVSFSNTSIGAATYTWSFGDVSANTDAANPQHIYTYVGTFTATLIAANGNWTDTTTAIIIIDIPSKIEIPNVFSPNSDGINDLFMVKSEGVRELNADIFNRWGQRVYTLTAPSQFWDGRLANGEFASAGTYYYMLKAKGFDGKDYEVKGALTLLK